MCVWVGGGGGGGGGGGEGGGGGGWLYSLKRKRTEGGEVKHLCSLCEKNCMSFQTANRVLSGKLLGSC